MELKDYIGKEVEVTLLSNWDKTSIRLCGTVVSDNIYIYLKYESYTTSGWNGMQPENPESDHKYWALNYGGIVWYKDMAIINSIEPKKYIKKHEI